MKEREKQLAKKEQSKELQLWVPVISAVSPPLKPEPVLGRGGRPGCSCPLVGSTRELDMPQAGRIARTALGLCCVLPPPPTPPH